MDAPSRLKSLSPGTFIPLHRHGDRRRAAGASVTQRKSLVNNLLKSNMKYLLAIRNNDSVYNFSAERKYLLCMIMMRADVESCDFNGK